MSDSPPNESEHNSPQEAAQLLPLVYEELRRLAAAQMKHERAGHTLDGTALVHEAYLRLSGDHVFASKSAFMRAAAEAMRRILIDSARRKRSLKRGGVGKQFELSESDRIHVPDPDTLLTIDETLSALADEDPQVAEIARLRLFVGMTIDETAEILGTSKAAAFRAWSFARARLLLALRSANDSRNS